jgi:hypothetical protein
MEDHGCVAVNSEKTIFMKHENGDWIMHGLFVDDMVHASTSEKLKLDFIAEYKLEGDFEITCEDLMTSFLGMEVQQDKSSIRLHPDNYIQDTLPEFKAAIKKFVKPKQMPMQPGIVLEHDLCPETPVPRQHKVYTSFVAKLQFAVLWIRCDIAFTASQLARFRVSAEASQWAALHHVMGYLEANPSFKRTAGGTSRLDGSADLDWGNSVSRRSNTGLMAQHHESR